MDSQSERTAWWSTVWRSAAMGHRRMNAAASCLLLRWTELGCWTGKRRRRNQWHIMTYPQSKGLCWISCKCFSLTEMSSLLHGLLYKKRGNDCMNIFYVSCNTPGGGWAYLLTLCSVVPIHRAHIPREQRWRTVEYIWMWNSLETEWREPY